MNIGQRAARRRQLIQYIGAMALWPARMAALLVAGAAMTVTGALPSASARVAAPALDSITGITASSPPA